MYLGVWLFLIVVILNVYILLGQLSGVHHPIFVFSFI